MHNGNFITIFSKRIKIVISLDKILYILMIGNKAEIHVSDGKVYETRKTLNELSENLGEGFVKINRGCLVSARAIHDITDMINLSNGESLVYTKRKKREIIEQFNEKRRSMIHDFACEELEMTKLDYWKYYQSFDSMPFAFTDIEMVFDDEKHAVDWIFCYGNPALAKLEKIPLERMIGSTFSSLFSNMDSKWLRSYERATIYGEKLEIMDYSPEIDTYLKVICFPTFKGHCGCILFDISEIKMGKTSIDIEKALRLYFGNAMES